MQIYKRVMALDSCENFVSAQYLKTEYKGFDRILQIDKLNVGIVMHQMVQIYNRFMALKSC